MIIYKLTSHKPGEDFDKDSCLEFYATGNAREAVRLSRKYSRMEPKRIFNLYAADVGNVENPLDDYVISSIAYMPLIAQFWKYPDVDMFFGDNCNPIRERQVMCKR